jgi:hypothetical protein
LTASDDWLVGLVTTSVSSACKSATAFWRSAPINSIGTTGLVNRSICARNNFIITDSPSNSFLRGEGYKAIDEGAQQHELADRNPQDRYNREAIRSGIKHPIRNLVRTAARLANQEVANTVMLVLTDHQYGLPHERMKGIGNHGFEGQKPGIMPPVRTAEPVTGQSR